MARSARPLSPHIGIYRWYFTMMLSIAHRATGIGLLVGLLLLVWGLVALASGPGAYAIFTAVMTSWLGYLVLFGLTFVTMLHSALGVRHLAWDAGYGYEKTTAFWSGRVAIVAAVALTILVWAAYLIVA